MWEHPHGQWPHFLTAALSFHSPLLAPNEAATCCSVELKMALPMQTQHPAKPSQAKVLTGGGDLREAQVDVPLSVCHSCV